MGTLISSYYRTIRAIIGDDDLDIKDYEDAVLQSKIIAVVNLGEVPGFAISEDQTEVIPLVTTQSKLGYVAADYGVAYGYAYNFAYAYRYNNWYDQGFLHLQETLQAALDQESNPDIECTPTGSPESYAKLIYAASNLCVVGLSDFKFKTRAVSESIDAPQELIFFIQNKMYSLKNGKKGSKRPPPLPVLALGIRSIWSAYGGTSGIQFGYFAGYDPGA